MRKIKKYVEFIKEEQATTTKLNNILDKMLIHGINSITPEERQYLDSFSSGEQEHELDMMNKMNDLKKTRDAQYKTPFNRRQSDNTVDYSTENLTFIYDTTDVSRNLITIYGSITYKGTAYSGKIIFNRQNKSYDAYYPNLTNIINEDEEMEFYQLIEDVMTNMTEQDW